MTDGANTHDVSMAVPLIAAVLAGLLGILGTVFVSGRGENLPMAVHVEFEKRMTEWHEDSTKQLGDINSRLSRLEGETQIERETRERRKRP